MTKCFLHVRFVVYSRLDCFLVVCLLVSPCAPLQKFIEDNWLTEFEKVVVQADPDLVALHCQEIGGKDFETDMPKVHDFLM